MYYNGMKKSLVSVLIPSNSEDLLSRAIDHILSSNVSEKDYEVIVCTKLPVAISHKKVKIISDPPDNVGSVRPLNECFKHSQGDYFVSIPDDLLLHPNCFNIVFQIQYQKDGQHLTPIGMTVVLETPQ